MYIDDVNTIIHDLDNVKTNEWDPQVQFMVSQLKLLPGSSS
jgi:hypothetical protein